jgi:hypothetical protein
MAAVVRRLIAQVQLAQPVEPLRRALCAWAETIGEGSCASMTDFHRIHRAVLARSGNPAIEKLLSDFYIAIGSLAAIERRPPEGFEGYTRLWDQQCSSNRIHRTGKSDFGRLQELEIRLGGVLLANRAEPYTLILPQPDGAFVVMGWQYVAMVDRSPFLDPMVVQFPVQLHAPPPPGITDAYRDPAPVTDADGT